MRESVTKAVEEGLSPSTIINDGLIAVMNIIGVKFKNNKVHYSCPFWQISGIILISNKKSAVAG
ncbi:B12-binding domain-containing protein [Moorellaceae bacterium AZ2]